MVRLFLFLLVVLGLAWGFSWLADRPGLVSITWQDHLIETSLMAAATAIAALLASAMLLWWILGVIWHSPHSVRRYFRARKRDRGYQALSTGLIAAGAGNAALARKMSQRTRGLLSADQEPLIHLLEAQASITDGKYDEARMIFEKMAQDPETRELGLRGLYMEARRLGADEAARQYAEKAVEATPNLPWAAQATLESRSRAGRWEDAIRNLDQQRASHIIPKERADRLKAVLLTAKATERLDGDPKGAREDAIAALKLARDLVPAAIIAAKGWLREDNTRKAASVLETIWKAEPHPEIASVYVRARSGDSATDRLKRAEKLESLRPNNFYSLMTVAEAALECREFNKARSKAEAALRSQPRESVFLLLADIEEAETGDQGRIRHWMSQALRAARDPAWVADGAISEKWLPLSPVTGRLDAFEWKAPFGQIEGPVEDGALVAETALSTLPAPMTGKSEFEAQDIAVHSQSQLAKPNGASFDTAGPTKVASPPEITPGAQPETLEEPAPFFGRPPDDPGVKNVNAAQPSTRLRLF